MYVCLCNAVSDTDIKEAVSSGADLADIQQQLGAGMGCGTCKEYTQQLVHQFRNGAQQDTGSLAYAV
jgi:bacterioferritin-associated ferredoxin